MKKSEMIDLMHKNISEVLCTTIEFNKDDCCALLEMMEDAGMLAPPIYSEMFGFEPEHKWEEEK